MDDMYEHNPILHKKRKLHAIMFSAIFVVVSAIFMFGLGNFGTQASRQRGNFLNADFWNATPNTGNIIYSLRGDGTPANTAYTKTWTGSCMATNVANVSPSFAGGTGQANTIYIINSGTYNLTQDIVLSGCSALVGRGEVFIRGTAQQITVNSQSFVILDNLNLSGVAVNIDHSNNIALHNLRVHHVTGDAVTASSSSSVMIAESQIYTNGNFGILFSGSSWNVINNVMSYNNSGGLRSRYGEYNTINNSQFFNNTVGIYSLATSGFVTQDTAIYNNNAGLVLGFVYGIVNDTLIYNNYTGAIMLSYIDLFGNTKMFDNTFTTGGSIGFSLTGTVPAGIGRTTGSLDIDTETTDYDRVTNPLSSTNAAFFTGGILNWTTQRGILSSYIFPDELRYLFGLHIPQQEQPVMYVSGTLVAYGSNGADYHTDKYIAEIEPATPTAQMVLVNQYFGSGSLYTQNRSGNGCSLGAFQTVTLTPGNYSPYTLQSHTIYILNPGEYTFTYAGHGFTFGGNCIALIGSGNVRIDKDNTFVDNLLYASGIHNIIIENVKLDGLYYSNNGRSNGRSDMGINFAGATYNTTINQVQSYNHGQYGIFLGIASHHNTIINTQVYNNLGAGIYFYLVSHHNVINNSMTYNNSGYGIWFANGSYANAMNNFQSFNNTVGIYGDLTTQQNIINKAMLYNNSEYGLLLKNSSGNLLNDVQIYHNTTGIKVEQNSYNNIYNGELKLFDNINDFEGTTGGDMYLNAGLVSPFATMGQLTLGSVTPMSCSYVTNPSFSGTSTYLLNTASGCLLTGTDHSIFSGWATSISYAFGANIYKQTLPYRYSTTGTIVALPTQYDSGKYIAEIFAIRDTDLEGVNFIFPPVIEPATQYTSDVYTATAINTTIHITFVNDPNSPAGYLKINGANVGLSGDIHNGDTIQIVMTSSSTLSEIYTGTLTNDSNGHIYDVVLQTKGPDIVPSSGSLAFANIIGAPRSSYTGSTTTVSDIDIGVTATIDTGRIAIYSGGVLVSSGVSGTVYSGNQLQAMILSSSGYSSVTTGTVTIGYTSASFTVWTLPDTSSAILSFSDPVATGVVYTDTIAIITSGSMPISYKFISSPNDCNSSGTVAYTGAITLTTQVYNGKYFCAYTTLSGIAMPLVSQNTINIDRTAPTTPTLLYPEDDDEIFFVVFEQTGSYDSGAGISGYEYIIAEDYNFIDIVDTGFVQTTGTSFSPLNFSETTGDFYRKIRTVDGIGLKSARSTQGYFVAIDNEAFAFDERNYAALDTDYTSNEITITGLRTYGLTLAIVDAGTIYKNDINKGKSTYVQNGDVIAIKLRSPSDYDESTMSTLTVANRSTDFIISTAPDGESCTLSTQDKGKIQIIYDNLVTQYSGDQNKYDQFLYTMKSMLQDQIDLTNDCNLQYLYDLINHNLHQNNLTGINTTGYIAPNCKAYNVSYNTGKVAYTSPDFKVPTYFANRDALTRYIDSKNPGDCHVSTTVNGTWYFSNTDSTKHVAPNGKLYTIQHETQGYTSAEFSVKKYFSTLTALRKYLDGKNPPFPIWSHTVDRTFTPVSYIAPNAKTYTIYKTNRGYMSYKLLNVKYYTTLDAIKSFINKNNPK